jgi:hypothetical protein
MFQNQAGYEAAVLGFGRNWTIAWVPLCPNSGFSWTEGEEHPTINSKIATSKIERIFRDSKIALIKPAIS